MKKIYCETTTTLKSAMYYIRNGVMVDDSPHRCSFCRAGGRMGFVLSLLLLGHVAGTPPSPATSWPATPSCLDPQQRRERPPRPRRATAPRAGPPRRLRPSTAAAGASSSTTWPRRPRRTFSGSSLDLSEPSRLVQ